MNLKQRILKYLDLKLVDFCKDNPNYTIFRFGSSVYNSQIQFNDIDFLICDELNQTDYTQAILNLKTNFSSDTFKKNAFKTTDKKIKNLFEIIQVEIKSKFSTQIQYGFNFGPTENKKSDKITYIHIAGPMNTENINYFFYLFPLFYTVLSKHHIKLSSADFKNIFVSPKINLEILNNSIQEIALRAINNADFKVKLKSLKRIKLLEYCYNDYSDAYILLQEYSNDLKKEEINAELERYYR